MHQQWPRLFYLHEATQNIQIVLERQEPEEQVVAEIRPRSRSRLGRVVLAERGRAARLRLLEQVRDRGGQCREPPAVFLGRRPLTRLPVLRLGAPGVLQATYHRAGFRDARARSVPVVLRLASAEECLRLVQETVVPITELLAGATDAQCEATWAEVRLVLRQFEGPTGFVLPGEVLVGTGTN